ncbi:MAG: RHS repeat-associated core domain-containing protein, partial [Candidatus Peribacteria bacterium]|nr:RHS repeat-associated core domain-containing protein [Candidatus Peribacteria bacterium]
DREIALYYFNARYYSPELGRFISRDPIGIIDDVNLYVYVGNNPLKWVDQSGMAKDLIIKIFKDS